jgi:putative transposase
VAEYWVRVPVRLIRGGLWIGLIKPYEPIPNDGKMCECKLYKRDNRWFLDIVVVRDVPERIKYQNIIAIDMGIHHIATSVELASKKTIFYDEGLNHIRGWYFWLRKQLGKKKAMDAIRKIGHHEKRITNGIIHNITREIVNRAVETNSLIILGRLKGLSRKIKRGARKFNRKLSGFQYYKFTQYLEYKSALAGIKVIKVFENWTSQTCYRCHRRGIRRKGTGLFWCDKCGEENADRNAAFNIAYRGLGYSSNLGVTVNRPRTFPDVERNGMMRKETREEASGL